MIYLVQRLANIYIILIILRAVLSWFAVDPYNPLYRFLISITEPVLAPIRRILPFSGIDLSPFIAILLIQILMNLLTGY